jgi:hypothetical protein
MDNWYQLPKKESLTFEEKSFKTSLLLNKFTHNLLKSMDYIVVNTEQFKMFQIQFSVLILNNELKKFLCDDKFITFLKNAELIEHVKKKETPYKDKHSRLSYYKGMYFTATDKGRMFLEKMKDKF